MQSVTRCGGGAYYHERQPTLEGPVRGPACGRGAEHVAFHSWRRRIVDHLGVEQPTYLVLRVPKSVCRVPKSVCRVPKSVCRVPACPRKYFTPPIAEAAPHAHTSRSLPRLVVRRYRRGRASRRAVAREVRDDFHTGTGKSSVLRWHQATLARDCPRPDRLAFSTVLCIAVYR